MTGNHSGHSLRPDIGFLELFASANTQVNIEANTFTYLSLMRLGGSITSLDQQSLYVFDETRWFYYLVGLANQPYSTIQAWRQWRGYLSLRSPAVLLLITPLD